MTNYEIIAAVEETQAERRDPKNPYDQGKGFYVFASGQKRYHEFLPFKIRDEHGQEQERTPKAVKILADGQKKYLVGICWQGIGYQGYDPASRGKGQQSVRLNTILGQSKGRLRDFAGKTTLSSSLLQTADGKVLCGLYNQNIDNTLQGVGIITFNQLFNDLNDFVVSEDYRPTAPLLSFKQEILSCGKEVQSLTSSKLYPGSIDDYVIAAASDDELLCLVEKNRQYHLIWNDFLGQRYHSGTSSNTLSNPLGLLWQAWAVGLSRYEGDCYALFGQGEMIRVLKVRREARELIRRGEPPLEYVSEQRVLREPFFTADEMKKISSIRSDFIRQIVNLPSGKVGILASHKILEIHPGWLMKKEPIPDQQVVCYQLPHPGTAIEVTRT